MKKFKVRTRYTCEDIYEVDASSAEEAEQMVMEGYHDYTVETDKERAYMDEVVVGTVELIGEDEIGDDWCQECEDGSCPELSDTD